MGYYTSYSMKVNNPEIIKNLISYNSEANYSLEENGETKNDSKWYDFERDLKEFSKKYSEEIIQLDGVGEDGKVFRFYFKNGVSQNANPNLVYPDCIL